MNNDLMTSIILRPHQETARSSMEENDLGKIILPTGAGKSIVFIKNTIEQFQSDTPRTVCVVAPRILLAVQLSADYEKHIDNARFIHIHSGSRLKHYRTTKTEDLADDDNNRSTGELQSRVCLPTAILPVKKILKNFSQIRKSWT